MKWENKMETLTVKFSYLGNSTFERCDLTGTKMNDVNLTGMVITDANMSDIIIDGVQLGGANIKNIGMPPEGHPLYDPNQIVQRPIKFENCDFNSSKISHCNLANVELEECDIAGMKINGILIEDLLKLYHSSK